MRRPGLRAQSCIRRPGASLHSAPGVVTVTSLLAPAAPNPRPKPLPEYRERGQTAASRVVCIYRLPSTALCLPSPMPGTIFITGGSGFVGTAVVEELLSRGYSVHALVNQKD